MALPLERSKKVIELTKQVILLYGKAKIGKSTFCSNFPNALFLATEPGLNHLSVYKTNIISWEKFLEACKDIASGQHKFETIIVDTVDNLVILCTEYVCNREKINHPSDYDYGKGWNMVTKELHRALAKLSLLPYGLVMIGHSKIEEVKTKTKSYSKETLALSGQNRGTVLNMADLVLFADIDENDESKKRIIHTKPSLYFDAGDRTSLGIPEVISLDYKEFAKYFEPKKEV